MVASPATAPVNNPRNLGFFEFIQSINNQVIAAKEAAISVFKNEMAVTESTLNSLPALNPYHPNQSYPVPNATKGILCGPLSTDFLLPTYRTDANAAIPAIL